MKRAAGLLALLAAVASSPAQAQNVEQILGTLIQGLGKALANQNANAPAPAPTPDSAPSGGAATAPAETTAAPSATAQAPTDWSVFFKSIEKGCTYSPAMTQMFEGMRQKRVQLDAPWRGLASTVTVYNRKEYREAVLKVKGRYYNLPLIEVAHYYGEENGVTGFYLIFNAPLPEVKKALSKVRYQMTSPGDNPEEPSAQFNIGKDDKGRAGIFCDTST